MRARWRWLGLWLALTLAWAGAAASQPARQPLTWPTLERFASEADFRSYVRAFARVRDGAAARRRQGKSDPGEYCPPEDFPCDQPAATDGDEEDAIVVTGTTRAAAPTSITNVQESGVDEGDIVKLYDRFLIVLQDGRLFSVDTGRGGRAMRVVDRANVYRHPGADVWYDEILVHENRVVVTGFNYGEDSTEYSVFSISRDGRFTREGAYFISSDDYYDVENYATRLVGGALVIYTPLDISGADAELDGDGRADWPMVRRWLREEDESVVLTTGRPLFDARNIYRPIQHTLEPTIHTISVCPLGSPRAGDELACRSTAIVGPPARQFYVSPEHVYLWLWPQDEDARGEAQRADCAARAGDAFLTAGPSALYQIALDDAATRALFVRGGPSDQLGMEADSSDFRALAVWTDPQCWRDRGYGDETDQPVPLRFVSAPLALFSATPQAAPANLFTPLPALSDDRALENRFAGGYLVYGGRSSWRSYAPDEDEPWRPERLVAVPSDNPSAARVFELAHNVLRIERVGDNAIATGYRGAAGLNVTLLDLGGEPRLASSVLIPGRFETEGRSHAFNSAVGEDGAGLMGMPTAQARGESGRWWWRSESSDVSFVSVDAHGALRSVGPLIANENAQHPSYRCQVSCVDWYGNSRPIFIAGRVFALSGVELVEGKVEHGAIIERGRVNLSAPLAP
jgi:Beta propeller domain